MAFATGFTVTALVAPRPPGTRSAERRATLARVPTDSLAAMFFFVVMGGGLLVAVRALACALHFLSSPVRNAAPKGVHCVLKSFYGQ
ncbi:protein of unknown function [Paraburkholderia dioscoreae]|uniref:Uncharacterized protein n=1 Tax=Paraburkholderia dioscoreae TaxID=2604047 RepID=A0A5Q4ZN89_9BURK|nr:protein of unknown function [Paraburkholderia dioscoreae]